MTKEKKNQENVRVFYFSNPVSRNINAGLKHKPDYRKSGVTLIRPYGAGFGQFRIRFRGAKLQLIIEFSSIRFEFFPH